MFRTPILKPWTAFSSELGCVFLYSCVSIHAVPSSGARLFLTVAAMPNGLVVTFPMQDEVSFVGEILSGPSSHWNCPSLLCGPY